MGTACPKCRYIAPATPAGGALLTECPKCGEPYEAGAAAPVYLQQHGDNDKIVGTLGLVAVLALLAGIVGVFIGGALVAGLYFLIFTTAMTGIAIVNAVNRTSPRQ